MLAISFNTHFRIDFQTVVVRFMEASDEFSLNINPGQERKIVKADKS